MFNVIRTQPAPASLAARRSYSEVDVIIELRKIFHDKCYICETKDPLSLNVEHFEAHLDDDEKKYDWGNLFFACARCNNIKRHHFNDLLNCTDPSVNAFRAIRHLPPVTPFSKEIRIEAMSADERSQRTARLIRKIFNDDNTGNKEVTGVYLRKRVFHQYSRLLRHINLYINEDSLPDEKREALERIKNMLGEDQEYSAFIRWAILDSPPLLDAIGVDLP